MTSPAPHYGWYGDDFTGATDTLATLAERGYLRAHRFDSGPARFEAEPAAHHDHLIDVDTGEVVEFLSAEIEELQRRVAERYGYEIVDHHLVLFGRRIAGS